MPQQYRVRLADGQAFDMHASAAAIRKQHPDARIEGRIEIDDLGQGRIVPYQGEQPVESAAVEAVEAPQSDEKATAAQSPARGRKG